jgi:hypothetical protein
MSTIEPSPYQHKCGKPTKLYADGVIWCDHCKHKVSSDDCVNITRGRESKTQSPAWKAISRCLAFVVLLSIPTWAQTGHTFAALDQSNQFTATQHMAGLDVNGAGPPEWTMPDTSSCPTPLTGTWGECSINGVPHIFALGSDQGAIVTAGAVGSPNGLAGLNGSALVPCTQLGTGTPSCNDATKYLNSTGTFTVPAGSGGTLTASGNTTVACTTTGTLTNGNLVKFDANGNCVDSGISASSSVLFFGTGGTGMAGNSNTTEYIGPANLSTTNDQQVETPMPKSGVLSNLQCRINITLTGAMQYVVTVRYVAYSSSLVASASTSLSCTLNSSNPSSCEDTNAAHNVTVAARGMVNLISVPTGNPTNAVMSCTLLLQ